jgi:adenosylcobinamide kinase/adenosylcobinamide-phosphate guanylyltransferase
MMQNHRLLGSTLVLGGARSGKSSYAESLIESAPGAWLYLATATAGDHEMQERIREHQLRRGSRWAAVEEPLALVETLQRLAGPNRAVLVDCLTLWLSNLMESGRDVDGEIADLAAALPTLAGPVVMVSNEVGLGIVPDNALARRFRDNAGRLHQMVAAVVPVVTFVAAGLPLHLKQPNTSGE